MPQIEGFLIEKLATGILYENQNVWGCVKRTDFYDDYCAYIKLHNPKYADPLPENIFGKELKRLLPDCVKITTGNIRVTDRDGTNYEKTNVYGFAPIEKCRRVLCDSINVGIKWEEPVKEQGIGILSTDGEYDFKKDVGSDDKQEHKLSSSNGEEHNKFFNDDIKKMFANIFEDKKETEITFEDGTTIKF